MSLLLLSFLSCLPPLPAAAQVASPPLPNSVPDRIQLVENSLLPYVPVEGLAGWKLAERMKYHRVPGLSIAVIRDYNVEWAKAYGWADTTARTRVTPATLFSAGSISKLVTAGAALALVQQGKLNLEVPINKYLKSWRLADNNFTRKRPVSQGVRVAFSPTGSPLSSDWNR